MKFLNMLVFISLMVVYNNCLLSQEDALTTYISRNYNQGLSDGVKILETAEGNYLISVTILPVSEHKSNSTLSRIATLKARSNVVEFINGSNITSSKVYKTSETVNGNSINYYESFISTIKEDSQGFVNDLELLDSFISDDGKYFILCLFREVPDH